MPTGEPLPVGGPTATPIETLTVATAQGRLRGERRPDCHIFRGVPYAAPPVGSRRYRPPVPAGPWPGERAALAFSPVAPQLTSTFDNYFGTRAAVQSEDCLKLNIWAPLHDGPHPVLVWLHGGAFVTGTAANPWYSGRGFARSGCVLVSANYRLGALGFAHLADLDGERFAASGNLGLLDQIAALAWVRDHIADFGGDPGNVTVFGESAGGASIAALLAAPAARGLLHRAVLQSASLPQLRSRARATEAGLALLAALGLDPSRVGELVDLPVERLLAAQRTLLADPISAFTAFAPTPDGTVLPQPVAEALAGGAAAGVPVLIGTTRDEMQLFTFADPAYTTLDDDGLGRRAARLFGDRAAGALAAYRAARPGATPGQIASAISTDQTFRVPATRTAEARHAHGAPVWAYWFTQATPVFGQQLGACHGLEIPFVFANIHQRGVKRFTGESDEREPVAKEMHAAWVAFARDGDPGWPAWDPARRATRVFGPPGGVIDDPEPDLRALWDAVR